jgi:hypothetical protein
VVAIGRAGNRLQAVIVRVGEDALDLRQHLIIRKLLGPSLNARVTHLFQLLEGFLARTYLPTSAAQPPR